MQLAQIVEPSQKNLEEMVTDMSDHAGSVNTNGITGRLKWKVFALVPGLLIPGLNAMEE